LQFERQLRVERGLIGGLGALHCVEQFQVAVAVIVLGLQVLVDAEGGVGVGDGDRVRLLLRADVGDCCPAWAFSSASLASATASTSRSETGSECSEVLVGLEQRVLRLGHGVAAWAVTMAAFV
jgi:hypothetical protein